MVLGKAELVENFDDKAIHSASSVFPWPSVIRLSAFIHVPYKTIILTRKNILNRDQHKCAYCGRGDITLTIDHIIPKSRGGQDVWENLVAACVRCNNSKGDRTPHEANMTLRIKPYMPNHVLFLKNKVGRLHQTWKQYLFQV